MVWRDGDWNRRKIEDWGERFGEQEHGRNKSTEMRGF